MYNHLLVVVTASMLALLASGTATASIIQVDFQPSGGVTQSGFTAITNNLTTTIGGVTFKVSGEFFTRNPGFTDSGAFTYEGLFDDFAYTNGTGTTAPAITLQMSGLLQNTAYALRFYSGDMFPAATYPVNAPWAGILTTTYSPIVGTGSTLSSTFDRTANPTTNDQYSALGTITSNASGQITMSIVGSSTSGYAFTRLNGLVLESQKGVIPEPATVIVWSLLATCALAFGWYRKRRAA